MAEEEKKRVEDKCEWQKDQRSWLWSEEKRSRKSGGSDDGGRFFLGRGREEAEGMERNRARRTPEAKPVLFLSWAREEGKGAVAPDCKPPAKPNAE